MANVLPSGTNNAPPAGPAGGDLTGSYPNPTVSGTVVIAPQALAPVGLTGATSASRYVGSTASGAPVSGTFAVGDFVVDRTGRVWICVTAGTPGTWTCATRGLQEMTLASRGLLAETAFPAQFVSGQTQTSQELDITQIGLRAGMVITNLHCYVGVAPTGAAPTDAWLALFDSSFNLLANTASHTAAGDWTAGLAGLALSPGTYTVLRDGLYYVGFLVNGTWGGTQISLNTSLASGSAAQVTGQNAIAYNKSGITTLPNPIVTPTPNRRAWWFGVS